MLLLRLWSTPGRKLGGRLAILWCTIQLQRSVLLRGAGRYLDILRGAGGGLRGFGELRTLSSQGHGQLVHCILATECLPAKVGIP